MDFPLELSGTMIAMVGVFALSEIVTAFQILGPPTIIGGSVVLRVASIQS
jgi:hypothetical protein